MIIVRAVRLDRRGVGVVGVAADSGGTHPPGDDFVLLGTHLNGLSTGQLSLFEPPSGHRASASGGFPPSAIEPGREIHPYTAGPAEAATIIRRATPGQAGTQSQKGNDHASDHPETVGLRPLRLPRMRPAKPALRLLLRLGRL